jgi:hypothetical protein
MTYDLGLGCKCNLMLICWILLSGVVILIQQNPAPEKHTTTRIIGITCILNIVYVYV